MHIIQVTVIKCLVHLLVRRLGEEAAEVPLAGGAWGCGFVVGVDVSHVKSEKDLFGVGELQLGALVIDDELKGAKPSVRDAVDAKEIADERVVIILTAFYFIPVGIIVANQCLCVFENVAVDIMNGKLVIKCFEFHANAFWLGADYLTRDQ